MAGTPTAHIDDIWALIQDNTSLAVVRDFLRDKKIAHSASSWTMLRGRIDAAIKDGKLTKEDLYDLLCIVEEHGKQHVFLYQRSKSQAAKMLERTELDALLRASDFPALPFKPKVLRKAPVKLTLVDVRYEHGESLVLKYVQRREKFVKDTEGEERAGIGKRQYVKRWDIEEVRTVNIIKLRGDGLAEIRIHSGYEEKYDHAVRELQQLTAALIPWERFSEISLAKAKDVLWSKRDDLKDLVAFTNSSLLDDSTGAKLNASTGRPDDDLRGSSAGDAIQTFIDHGAHVDGSSIYFKPQERADGRSVPARLMHVVLRGRPNEYVVPVQCGIMDYEHALGELRRYNR